MLPAHQNPVRMELIARVPFRFEIGDWQSNLNWLARLKFRAAIVGRQGSGKTTLISELASRIPNSCHLEFPHDQAGHNQVFCQAMQAIENQQVLLIDGIERISWWARERIYFGSAGRAGLVVCVHQRCRLPTWIHCRTNVQLISRVIADLGLDTPAIQTAAREAFHRCGGNVRNTLRLLYDQFAAENLSVPIRAYEFEQRQLPPAVSLGVQSGVATKALTRSKFVPEAGSQERYAERVMPIQ